MQTITVPLPLSLFADQEGRAGQVNHVSVGVRPQAVLHEAGLEAGQGVGGCGRRMSLGCLQVSCSI